jgi:glycerol-3-phosphate acyltransferase PlsX
MANPLRKAGAFLSRGAYMSIRQSLNPEALSGAPLLGLNQLVIKAHGSSKRAYVAGAIRVTIEALSHDITGAICADLAKLAALTPKAE